MTDKKPKVVEGDITYQLVIHHESSYACKVTHTLVDRLAMLHFVKEHIQLALHEDSNKTDKKKRMTMKEREILASGNATMQIMIEQIYPAVYKEVKDLIETGNIEESSKLMDWAVKVWTRVKGFFRFR